MRRDLKGSLVVAALSTTHSSFLLPHRCWRRVEWMELALSLK
jgi:hypothetical protein